MVKLTRREREVERRTTVERYHQLADAAEEFQVARTAAISDEQRQRITNEFAAFRSAHRAEDVRRGKRPEGTSVMMHRVLWATWATIAGEHLQRARDAYVRISDGDVTALVPELHESLVAIGAAAAAIEAVFEDLVYLVPQRPTFRERYEQVADLLATALGLDATTVASVRCRLEPLFDARNGALHPYSELEVPKPHPAWVGFTGAEHSTYNAVTAESAVVTALLVIDLAASPPEPANRWVSRWCDDRRSYFDGPIAQMRADVGL